MLIPEGNRIFLEICVHFGLKGDVRFNGRVCFDGEVDAECADDGSKSQLSGKYGSSLFFSQERTRVFKADDCVHQRCVCEYVFEVIFTVCRMNAGKRAALDDDDGPFEFGCNEFD